MGKTSPNNKIKKVTKITSMANFKTSEVIWLNTVSPIYAKINTIKILIKLFEMSIVANSFCGFSNSSTTTFCMLDLDSEALFSPHDGIVENYPDYYKNVYLKNHDLAFLGNITPDEYVKLMKKETIRYWENQ